MGKTTLLTTHKQGMLDLVERIIVLDNGSIIFDGPRDECLKRFSQPSLSGEATT
jgi:ATP-binding cassette subfamily C protein LapB